jgi:hypothetical protein
MEKEGQAHSIGKKRESESHLWFILQVLPERSYQAFAVPFPRIIVCPVARGA